MSEQKVREALEMMLRGTTPDGSKITMPSERAIKAAFEALANAPECLGRGQCEALAIAVLKDMDCHPAFVKAMVTKPQIAFEQWAEEKNFDLTMLENGTYRDGMTLAAYEAWRASK